MIWVVPRPLVLILEFPTEFRPCCLTYSKYRDSASLHLKSSARRCGIRKPYPTRVRDKKTNLAPNHAGVSYVFWNHVYVTKFLNTFFESRPRDIIQTYSGGTILIFRVIGWSPAPFHQISIHPSHCTPLVVFALAQLGQVLSTSYYFSWLTVNSIWQAMGAYITLLAPYYLPIISLLSAIY